MKPPRLGRGVQPSSWLQATQWSFSSQLAGDAQCDVRRGAGQLVAQSRTFALLDRTGPDAASCYSYGWAANALYSAVSNSLWCLAAWLYCQMSIFFLITEKAYFFQTAGNSITPLMNSECC